MGLEHSFALRPSFASSITLYKSVFTSETLAITVGAFLIGYQLGELYEEFHNLPINNVKMVSHLCPECNQNPFMYVHKDCRHILACEGCYQRMDAKCKSCKKLITINSVEKVYF